MTDREPQIFIRKAVAAIIGIVKYPSRYIVQDEQDISAIRTAC